MYIAFLFILGGVFGSFINCLIYRINKEETIMGRSYCPNCKHSLGFFDLFPFFSYIFLLGKCKYCRKKISFQYFVVEFFTGVLFAFAYIFINNSLFLFFYLIITLFLLIIFIYDLKYYLVVDQIIYPAIAVSLLYRIFFNFNLLNIIISLAIGFLFFWIQYIVSSGKWIGGGDVLIGLMIGSLFNWQLTLLCIFMSYIIGSFFGIFLIILGKKNSSSKIPFGPFLTISIWFVFVFGDVILNWYLSILNIT
ncbi:MAG: prepilin peptidase [Patescibacteria group bacterium]|nr:prepilin peptidase [Patescibacteria group bacterium]MDD4304540.1 prepilin peptidase [Patescibacteria group bacterium]MDD4695648.1 prepilin peptidase [Patescibacteria group bacterium]